MGEPVKRRLFIGGLHQALTEHDLRERFDRHGTISSVEIKKKDDSRGKIISSITLLFSKTCVPNCKNNNTHKKESVPNPLRIGNSQITFFFLEDNVWV